MTPEADDIIGIRRRIEELADQIRASRANEQNNRPRPQCQDAAADARARLLEALRVHEALIEELRAKS